jgi:hypothetical protein
LSLLASSPRSSCALLVGCAGRPERTRASRTSSPNAVFKPGARPRDGRVACCSSRQTSALDLSGSLPHPHPHLLFIALALVRTGHASHRMHACALCRKHVLAGGYTRGAPDMLALERGADGSCGLAIEFKVRCAQLRAIVPCACRWQINRNELSRNQLNWFARLSQVRARACATSLCASPPSTICPPPPPSAPSNHDAHA